MAQRRNLIGFLFIAGAVSVGLVLGGALLALAQSYIFRMPVTGGMVAVAGDPTVTCGANQALTFDGSWGCVTLPSGGTSPWTMAEEGIAYSAGGGGGVGIGTEPIHDARLQVAGSRIRLINPADPDETVELHRGTIELSGGTAGVNHIDFKDLPSDDYHARISRGPGDDGDFSIANLGAGGLALATDGATRLNVQGDGDVALASGSSLIAGLTYVETSGCSVSGRSCTVSCPAGLHVLGGGCHVHGWGNALRFSKPYDDKTGWECFARDAVATMDVYAICARIK